MTHAAETLGAIAEEIRTHTGCGQEPCETCTSFVPGEGDPAADVVLVGEAPGAAEDRSGRPFVGSAGRLLDQLLEEAGISRHEVFITNVVKARPPGNRDPKRAEVEHHLPWLEAQLAVLQPKLVVPLGRHALGHFVTGVKVTEVHGRVIQEGAAAAVFPMLHPAAALHNQGLRDTLFADARLLGRAVRERSSYPSGVPTLKP